MDAKQQFKKSQYTEHLKSLKRACEWLGISQGRAAKYVKLVKEFFKNDKRSQEHILAFNESCEITDIYESWKPCISNFPGLYKKIRKVCRKGPVLREDERPSKSSNRPRNDAFAYFLAGKLMTAGIQIVAVDGVVRKGISSHRDADITFGWNGALIDIECKRPQTEKALKERVKEASKQITNPKRQGRIGIIAIDCSVFVRPPGKLLEKDSGQRAEEFLSQCLAREIKPQVKTMFGKTILGFLLFARAPHMALIKISPVVSPRGEHFRYYRPESISTFLVIGNPTFSITVLQFICKRLV